MRGSEAVVGFVDSCLLAKSTFLLIYNGNTFIFVSQ